MIISTGFLMTVGTISTIADDKPASLSLRDNNEFQFLPVDLLSLFRLDTVFVEFAQQSFAGDI